MAQQQYKQAVVTRLSCKKCSGTPLGIAYIDQSLNSVCLADSCPTLVDLSLEDLLALVHVAECSLCTLGDLPRVC